MSLLQPDWITPAAGLVCTGMVRVMDNLAMWKECVVLEKILDKIDEWNYRLDDWQQGSDSRSFLVFCLQMVLVIPFGFAVMGIIAVLLLFFCWSMGALLGV